MAISGIGGATVAVPWSVHASTSLVQPKRIVGQTSFADDGGNDAGDPSARASIDTIILSQPVKETGGSEPTRNHQTDEHRLEIVV